MANENYEAVITVRVVVPFAAKTTALPEDTFPSEAEVSVEREFYKERKDAARYAEGPVCESILNAISPLGQVLNYAIEEVRSLEVEVAPVDIPGDAAVEGDAL